MCCFHPENWEKMIQCGWFNQPAGWFCVVVFNPKGSVGRTVSLPRILEFTIKIDDSSRFFNDAGPMDPLGINASTKSRWRAQSIAYLIRFNERTRKAVDHLRVFVCETGNDDSYFFHLRTDRNEHTLL